jgi:hypothetical protein
MMSNDSLWVKWGEGPGNAGSVPVRIALDVGEVQFKPSFKSGRFPEIDSLFAKPAPDSRRIEVTFDAALLAQIAASTKGHAHVTLVLDSGKLVRGDDGRRRQTTAAGHSSAVAVLVKGSDVQARLMPVHPEAV